jgi:nucleoside-diphosphate-sugar epimerase
MKKIFITGATGFVGGAIARRLAPDNWVLAMVRGSGSDEKIKALGVRPVLCTLESIGEAMLRECDVVIHCAAYVEPWGRYQDFYHVNVEGTQRMLDMARKAGVKRFIFIGTEAALFAGQDMLDINETYPYPHKSPYHYSETKKLAERLVLEANDPGKFETISIRPRMVWGPGDETLLPNLVEMVDSGRFRWIDGGDYLTSTCHIYNLVDAVLLAMERGKGGEAYFITDKEVSTMRQFMTQWIQTAGRNPGNKSVPGWLARFMGWLFEGIWKLFRIRKKPPVTRFAAAIMSAHCTIRSDKAAVDLGYSPAVTVEEGMKMLTKPTAQT